MSKLLPFMNSVRFARPYGKNIAALRKKTTIYKDSKSSKRKNQYATLPVNLVFKKFTNRYNPVIMKRNTL